MTEEQSNRRDEVVRRIVKNAPVGSRTVLGGAYAGKVSPRGCNQGPVPLLRPIR
jgi:hypothetical protein